MNANSSRLGQKEKPLGVIDALSAGISVVAQHPWLLLLPILFDLFLWLGPRLALDPSLIQAITAPLDPQAANVASLPASLTTDLGLFYDTLQSQLQGANLWSFLILPLLFWPTLVTSGPAGALDGSLHIDQIATVLLLVVGLSLLGLWLNMVWLQWVARSVEGQKWLPDLARVPLQALRQGLRFLGAILLLLFAFMAVMLPLSFVVALITLFAPGIGAALGSLLTIGATWLTLWVGMHFYFTAGALVLDGAGILQALGNSGRIVRTFFWSAFGFIVLSTLLSAGFQLIWLQLSETSAGRATSIVGNAALGTAIAAAMFIFYRDRVRFVANSQPAVSAQK